MSRAISSSPSSKACLGTGGLLTAGLAAAIVAGTTQAALVTYSMSLENQSGSVGGTSFSSATIHLQYTGDTANIVSDGYSMTGDRIGFTITGGNTSSDIVGTFALADNWKLKAYNGTGMWVFEKQQSSNYISAFGFRAPSADQTAGASTTFASGTNMLTAGYSQTVTGYTSSGQSSPTGGTGFLTLGGATPFANWAGVFLAGVGSSLGTFSLSAPGSSTYYNGSFGIPYTPSAVPGSGLACLGSLGLAGFARRRR